MIKNTSYKNMRERIGCYKFHSKILKIILVILHLLLVNPYIPEAKAQAAPRQITTPQSFQTDLFSGSAIYQIPITVPAGRRNIEPELMLNYFSSAANGLLGLGWNLDMGYIQRSIKDGAVDYTNDNFSFYVRGVTNPMVKLDTYDNVYRAKLESAFQDFVYEEGFWNVIDKGGKTFRFGYNQDAKISHSTNGVFRWYLDRVVDTHGNFMKFSYWEDTGGQVYLTKIEYTGFQDKNGNEIESAPHSVEFIWQDRTDASVNYITGEKITTNYRLQAIKVYVGMPATKVKGRSRGITRGFTKELVRRYELGYQQSSVSGRSLLKTITQYGKDGLSDSPLITINFSYRSPENGWSENSSWQLPDSEVYFINQEGDTDYHEIGTNLLDANADGFADIVRNFKDNSGAYKKYVWLNNKGQGWVNSTSWAEALPDEAAFIYKADSQTYADYGTRIADVNGDGLQDLIRSHVHKLDEKRRKFLNKSNEGSYYVWLNTGSGWKQDSMSKIWQDTLPADGHFIYQLTDTSYIDAGTRLVDINGDTSVDIVRIFKSYKGVEASVRKVWLNSSQGWVYSAKWSAALPAESDIVYQPAEYEYYGMGVVFVDVNDDGLVDIVRNRLHSNGTSLRNVWLNTGSGWVQDDDWTNLLPQDAPVVYQYDDETYVDYGVRFVDINSDNSTDIVLNRKHNDGRQWRSVWLNIGKGWQYSQEWSEGLPTDCYFSFQYNDSEFFNAGVRVADLDGDGAEDFIRGFRDKNGANYSTGWLDNGFAPDLLERINNGVGADIKINYRPSTQYVNTGIDYVNSAVGIAYYENDGISDLPFVVQTVSSINVDDGNALTPAYTINYWYEGGMFNWGEMEFWGFGHTTVTDPEGNLSDSYFYQAYKDGEEIDVYRGKVRIQEKRDKNKNLYSTIVSDWNHKDLYNGMVFFPYLSQKDIFTYDGDEETYKHARINYFYNTYGNLSWIKNFGDIGNEDDDRLIEFDYIYNFEQRILDKHSQTRIIKGSDYEGQIVSESTFYYDNSNIPGEGLTVGNLTKEERWIKLPDGSSNKVATNFEYDSYGNVTAIVDSELHRTETTYDNIYHTFPIEIKNSLGQTYQFNYDIKTAQVLTVTDPNGNVTKNVYDEYGRLKEVYTPLDNEGYPSLGYEYYLEELPMRIVTYTRQDHNQPNRLVTHNFFDGFGRKIQTRNEAEEEDLQVVSDTVSYNWRGQIDKQWLPNFQTASTLYASPNTSNPYSQFEYDTQGRQTKIINPDANQRSIQYSDWTVTIIDELGRKIVYYYDAYNRLGKLEEYNKEEIYTTIYEYDTLDNLIKTIDNQKNETIFSYDSLSFKRSIDDPDMGNWKYEYDNVGNLIKQTDAKGQVVNFKYDALNRLILKDYEGSQPDANYYYDGKTYDSAGQSAIPDSIGRLSQIVDGSGIITTFYYDKLGREIQVAKTIEGNTYATSRDYDALSRAKYIVYPDGEKIYYTYNNQGQIERVYSNDFTYVNNAKYNAAGQLEKIYYKNDQSLITEHIYNPNTLRLDKLSTTTNDNTIQSMEYGFDGAGNLKEIYDYVAGSTNRQSFEYDDLNRLTLASNPQTYGAINYDYDSIGNMVYKNGINYYYQDNGPHQVSSSDEGLSVSYDTNGNMLTKNEWAYTYDVENKITSATEDVIAVEINLKPGWNIFSLPLLPADPKVISVLSGLKQGQDYSQISTYDASTKSYKHFINSDVNQFSEFEYDKGYFINVTNPEGIKFTITGNIPDDSTTANLEPGWNLIGSPTLSDIKVDNLFSPLKIGSNYLQLSRYNPETKLFEDYVNKPDTDDFNLVEKARGYYIYCPQNTSWYIPSDINTITFKYDSEGRRVKKNSAWEETIYVGPYYEVSKPARERASLARKHIYFGSNRSVTITSDGKKYFYHPDHLGSSNVVTDDLGNVIQRIEYAPFGETAQFSGSDVVRHKFTGQEWDNETGLYYYGNRYYDPALGKFISPDNRIPQPLDPQALNRIAYARNNPEIIIDPTGEFFWFIVIAIIVAAAATVYVAETIEEAIEDAAEEIADAIRQAAAEIAAAIRDIEITININIDIDIVLGGSESSGGYTRNTFNSLTSVIEPNSLILTSPNASLLNPLVTAGGASSDISTSESRKLLGKAAKELSAFGLSEQAAVVVATSLVDLSVDNGQIGPTGIKFSSPSGINSGRVIGSQSGARFSSYNMAQISAKNSVDTFNAPPTLTRFMSRILPAVNSGVSDELFMDQAAISDSLGAGPQRGPSEDIFVVKESANLGTQPLRRISSAFR